MHFNQNKKNIEKQKHIKDTKAWAKEMGALMFDQGKNAQRTWATKAMPRALHFLHNNKQHVICLFKFCPPKAGLKNQVGYFGLKYHLFIIYSFKKYNKHT